MWTRLSTRESTRVSSETTRNSEPAYQPLQQTRRPHQVLGVERFSTAAALLSLAFGQRALTGRTRSTPMRRLITGLAILAANSVLAPAGYADYLSGEWYIISNKARLSTSAAGHPLLKDSAKWVKDGAEVRILALPNDSAWQVRLTNGAWWGVNLPTPLWDKNVELAK